MLILLIITYTHSIQIKSNSRNLTNVERFKVLFMLKYPTVRADHNNPLNNLAYRNLILANDQLIFFMSDNVNDPVSIIN
jgi:hypothetical protein